MTRDQDQSHRHRVWRRVEVSFPAAAGAGVLGAIALAAFAGGYQVGTAGETTPTVAAVPSVPEWAWEPEEVLPDPGCRITETVASSGRADGEQVTPPAALTLTCGTTSTVLTGDFTHNTANTYDPATTGVRQVIVIGDEARIWHQLRGEGCLTIQVLDDLDPLRDDCDTTTTEGGQNDDHA